MAHRYQSRFSYRPLGEYMLGEYLRPTGFGTYTLGSLSNRPGKDWATPRYVRDEPDKFMSGYGDEYDDIQAQYEADKALIDAGGVPADLVTDIQEGPPVSLSIPVQMGPTSDLNRPLTEDEKAAGQAAAAAVEAEQKKAVAAAEPGALDWLKKNLTGDNLTKALQLAQTGVATGTAIYRAVTGQDAATAPVPYNPYDYDPYYDPNANVQVEAVRVLARNRSNVFFSPEFLATHVGVPVYKPGTVTPNTMLLLAGAAVVAFLVLGKK